MPDKTGKRTIKFKFYHNDKSQPIITLCVIREPNGDEATGMAICSDLDPFNGKIGKKIALGRAFKALGKRGCCSRILRPEVEEKIKPLVDIWFKCLFIHNPY